VRKLAEHSAGELGDPGQTHLFDSEPQKQKRHAWAWLLKMDFLVDVTECPWCKPEAYTQRAQRGRRMKGLEV
jgi:hypothetical protein